MRNGDLGSQVAASMRPPVLPSGNPERAVGRDRSGPFRFNEAAGFTQRKPTGSTRTGRFCDECFNEAAGFTQRKQ